MSKRHHINITDYTISAARTHTHSRGSSVNIKSVVESVFSQPSVTTEMIPMFLTLWIRGSTSSTVFLLWKLSVNGDWKLHYGQAHRPEEVLWIDLYCRKRCCLAVLQTCSAAVPHRYYKGGRESEASVYECVREALIGWHHHRDLSFGHKWWETSNFKGENLSSVWKCQHI